ncbi:MAG: hypothetical protein ABI851_07625 [Saprospiraceae bacterium]
MKNKIIICIALFIFSNINKVNAQMYDGNNDNIYTLGAEINKKLYYCNLTADIGLSDYISGGVFIKYLFNNPKPVESLFSKFLIGARLDVHGSNFFKLKKSDILLGYEYGVSYHGPHTEYRYAITDFFGFFGRAIYNINISNEFADKSEIRAPLSLEAGIHVRFFNGI